MKSKKIPMRKCITCNENFSKKELIRIVNNKDEGILVDYTGKSNGRGAYVCKSTECIKNIKKTGKLANALKSKIPEIIYEEIEDYVSES